MLSTNFPRFVLLMISAVFSLSVQAQTTKEAVILYNSQPVRAKIASDGEVISIIRDEPDYLKGFVLKIQDYGQFLVDQQQIKTEETQAVSETTANQTSKPAHIVVPFESDFAILSDLAITRLDSVVQHLKENPYSKVVIRTLSTIEESLVDKNRLNSIRTYLKIRGIAHERITYETLGGDRDVNEVTIEFIK